VAEAAVKQGSEWSSIAAATSITDASRLWPNAAARQVWSSEPALRSVLERFCEGAAVKPPGRTDDESNDDIEEEKSMPTSNNLKDQVVSINRVTKC